MNYAVARIETRTRETVQKYERHNERTNESYANMNVDLERTPMNVHYKSAGDRTYNETLDKLVEEGRISLRGLKKDARLYDELILDVNSDYFEQRGGYDYAVPFYEAAYGFAEKLYGKENVISAVLHADEINLNLTEKTGHPVYHYHLHVMALPVVEKEIRWSKRCKDPALVGTVKEVIHQISHSKKWASDTPMVDEAGQPVLNKNGKPKYVASYSLLQDQFLQYMQERGYSDLKRGQRGSTAEHLSSLDYKIQQDQKRLKDLTEKIEQAQVQYEPAKNISMTLAEIDSMGKSSLLGKMQMSREDCDTLTSLAKEGITSRSEINSLRGDKTILSMKLTRANSIIADLQSRLEALQERCKPFLQALEYFPELVRQFIDAVSRAFSERAARMEQERKDAASRRSQRGRSHDMERYLGEKLCEEAEGILIWAIIGLKRLIRNQFRFTTSERSRENMEEAIRDANNVVGFMESEGYFRFKSDGQISSKDFYSRYLDWCEDNAFHPISSRSFGNYLSQNAAEYHLEHDNNVKGQDGKRVWGYWGIEPAN